MISYEDFRKTELKTAKIVDVQLHPNADKLYVVTIDIAGEKKNIVAGIRNFYKPEELIGKNVAVVINLEPAVIRGVESSGMLLAASNENSLSILTLDKDLPSGSLIK